VLAKVGVEERNTAFTCIFRRREVISGQDRNHEGVSMMMGLGFE
jgi:hypothetical protein